MNIKDAKAAILGYLPKDGRLVGNFSVMRHFKLPPQEYWPAVRELFDEGAVIRGRGKGGSVSLPATLVGAAPTPAAEAAAPAASRERDYYPGIRNYFVGVWAELYGIDQYVIEQTADQGRRPTGGAWTRPDFGLAAVKNFEFVPGRLLEIVSIEVKKTLGEAVVGVYEAVAHSAFCNRSILVAKIEAADTATEDFERISEEAQRFGLGLIVFTDANDPESFDIVLDGSFRAIDPEKANNFIATQFSDENKKRLRNWLKS